MKIVVCIPKSNVSSPANRRKRFYWAVEKVLKVCPAITTILQKAIRAGLEVGVAQFNMRSSHLISNSRGTLWVCNFQMDLRLLLTFNEQNWRVFASDADYTALYREASTKYKTHIQLTVLNTIFLLIACIANRADSKCAFTYLKFIRVL